MHLLLTLPFATTEEEDLDDKIYIVTCKCLKKSKVRLFTQRLDPPEMASINKGFVSSRPGDEESERKSSSLSQVVRIYVVRFPNSLEMSLGT